jgi:hypothetical protein
MDEGRGTQSQGAGKGAQSAGAAGESGRMSDNRAVADAVDRFVDRLQHGSAHEPPWAMLLRFELAAQAAVIAALEARIAALESGAMRELAKGGMTGKPEPCS